MGQLDSHKEETINRLILSTIPVVDKKLKEQEEKQQIENKKFKYINIATVLRKKNQESRIVNEREVAKSKDLLTIIKQHNSMHLKKSTQEN